MFDYGAGIKNPLFFIGIVEDVRDPRYEGRVKVRAFGIHGTKDQIPSEELPWALVVKGDYDPNGSPLLGMPAGGSWVFGMFIDGRQAQQPMVLGLLPLQNTKVSNPDEDGIGNIPPENAELTNRGSAPEDFGQPANHRLARGEYIDETYVVDQEVSRVMNVAFGGDEERSWSEPGSAYAAKYPFNRVFSSGAHTIELDDTKDAERIMIYHKEGSYIQIDSRGTVTNKTTSDQFDVIDKNSHVVIGGSGSGFSTVTINGNSYVKVNGNKVEEITGDHQQLVHGNYLLSVGGQMNLVGEMAQLRGGDVKIHANAGTFAIKAAKELQLQSGEGAYFKSEKVFIQGTDTLNIRGNETRLEGTESLDIFGKSTKIQGSESFNIKGDASLVVGSDGNVSVRGTTVYIDDNVSMANGSAATPGNAFSAAGAIDAASVEAPEPVTKNTSIMPVNETGSVGSSGIAAQDTGGSAKGNGTTGSGGGGGSTSGPVSTATKTAVAPLLDLINRAESRRNGYDAVYSVMLNAGVRPPKPLTQMTIQEVLNFQEANDRRFGSEPMGRYQIIEDTLRGYNNQRYNSPEEAIRAGRGQYPLYQRAGLSAGDMFSPENQDKMAIQLLREAKPFGLDSFMENPLTDVRLLRFGNGVAKIWAGLPKVSGPDLGKSEYEGIAGNSSTVSVQEYLSVLRQIHTQREQVENELSEEAVMSQPVISEENSSEEISGKSYTQDDADAVEALRELDSDIGGGGSFKLTPGERAYAEEKGYI